MININLRRIGGRSSEYLEASVEVESTITEVSISGRDEALRLAQDLMGYADELISYAVDMDK